VSPRLRQVGGKKEKSVRGKTPISSKAFHAGWKRGKGEGGATPTAGPSRIASWNWKRRIFLAPSPIEKQGEKEGDLVLTMVFTLVAKQEEDAHS